MKNIWGKQPTPTENSMKPVTPMGNGFSVCKWQTQLPEFLCDEITKYYNENCEPHMAGSLGRETARKVEARWSLPFDWVPSFFANYIQVANDRVFQYDLRAISYNEIHHLTYHPGYFYDWHCDTSIEMCTAYYDQNWSYIQPDFTEYVRKISFTLQLSHPDEYEGGDIQILDDFKSTNGKLLTVPKEKGSLVMFDSRLRHRVKPVKSGTRNCLVGWALGPRWK